MSRTDLAIEARTNQQHRLEAVGLMTAGLAHDLANSVQTLTSAGNILQAHALLADAADLRPTLDGAAVALRHVETMVSALLGFVRSRPDDRSPFDPAECVRALEPLLRWSIAADVVLSLHLQPELPRLDCNRQQLESALLNLVRNSNQAIAGGGLIVVAVSADHDRRNILLEVADSGAGMSAGDRSRAFEPFFTMREAGTGLGLATVQRFAQDHGGDVSIDSEPDGGTNVQLRLPAADDEKSHRPLSPANRAAPQASAGLALKRRRALPSAA
jgi:signal transduction histidine kinase